MNDAESMKTAAQLIKAGKYAAARALLADVQEPEHRAKAQAWIARIDAMTATTTQQPMAQPYGAAPDFTTKAVLAFVLMWLFFVPGLVAAVMWRNQAQAVEDQTGVAPPGKQALVILAWLPLLLLVFLLVFLVLWASVSLV